MHILDRCNNDKLDAVKEVGVAIVGSAGLLIDAAGDGIKMIVSSTCEGIAKVVRHKMGDEAGHVTGETLGVVQDLVAVGQNARQAGVKGFVTATAVNSANVAVREMNQKSTQQ